MEIVLHELGHAVLGLADEYVESSQAYPQKTAWVGDGFPQHRNLSFSPNPAKFK